MKFITKVAVAFTACLLVSACGGGGSNSGGGDVGPTQTKTTYRGTYDAIGYRGNITVELTNGQNPVFTITGVPCLSGPLTGTRMESNVSGLNRIIGGRIDGVPDNGVNTPATIVVEIPNRGPGSGTIRLGPPAPCFTVQGTVNITSVDNPI